MNIRKYFPWSFTSQLKLYLENRLVHSYLYALFIPPIVIRNLHLDWKESIETIEALKSNFCTCSSIIILRHRQFFLKRFHSSIMANPHFPITFRETERRKEKKKKEHQPVFIQLKLLHTHIQQYLFFSFFFFIFSLRESLCYIEWLDSKSLPWIWIYDCVTNPFTDIKL